MKKRKKKKLQLYAFVCRCVALVVRFLQIKCTAKLLPWIAKAHSSRQFWRFAFMPNGFEHNKVISQHNKSSFRWKTQKLVPLDHFFISVLLFVHDDDDDDDKPSDNQKLKYREKMVEKKTKCNRDTLTHRENEWVAATAAGILYEFHHGLHAALLLLLFFFFAAFRRYRTYYIRARIHHTQVCDNSKSTDCIRPIYGFMRVKQWLIWTKEKKERKKNKKWTMNKQNVYRKNGTLAAMCVRMSTVCNW